MTGIVGHAILFNPLDFLLCEKKVTFLEYIIQVELELHGQSQKEMRQREAPEHVDRRANKKAFWDKFLTLKEKSTIDV